MNQHTILHIPPLMWQQFRQAMLQTRNDNEEVIGFFFCQRHQLTKRHQRFFPKAWVVPSPDCYERQSVSELALKQEFHLYLLKTYLFDERLDIVHIHTHPGGTTPHFSGVDDHHEARYASFLSSHCSHKPRLISGVFDESLEQYQFRLWNRKGSAFTSMHFSSSWFASLDSPLQLRQKRQTNPPLPEIEDNYLCKSSVSAPPKPVVEQQLMFARQQVFGDTVQKHLGELTVALIGCGGIGAVFTEQLARLGVKRWLLVDPDRIETVNLNRLPGATQTMVEQRWHKVGYLKWLIKRVYERGSMVKTFPTGIEDEFTQSEIATADLIVVATDNHFSRQVSQELALEYQRPLVCLGTHIEIQPNHQPRLYCRVTVPPLGGSWCLMCGNIINLHQAALESAPHDITASANNAGYLEGIEAPAVFWLNSICASTGVGIIHGLVSGFLNLDTGLDWIYDFPRSQWLQTDAQHLHTPNCYFCASKFES